MSGRMNRWAFRSAAMLAAVYLLWLVIPKSDLLHAAGINILQSLSACYAVILLVQAHRQSRDRRIRFWLYCSLASFCYALGQLYWTLHLLVFRTEPTFGLAEGAWCIQYVFMLLALGEQIKKSKNGHPVLRFVLDMLLFVTAFISLGWHYLIDYRGGFSIQLDLYVLFYLFCTSANAMVLFGLAVMSLYERKIISPRVNRMLMLGFAVKTLANISFLYGLKNHIPMAEHGLPELLWFLGPLPLGWAPLTSEPGPAKRLLLTRERRNHLRKWIPYFSVTLLFVAILFGIEHINALVLGTVIGVYLLIIRLFLSLYEHELSEKALQEAESKYRSLVENSQVGVYLEQNGKLCYVNRHCASIFGCLPDEMLGKPLTDFLAAGDRPTYQSHLVDLQRYEFTSRMHLEGLKPAGKLYLEIQATEMDYRGGQAISGTLLDITDRHVSAEILRRSEKLSVVGQLAAGVAHEIRNPLTALKGFAQMLKARADDNQHYYEIMLTELERINFIVSEFMMLSKPQQLQRLGLNDLRSILRDIVPIIETQSILNNVIIGIDWGDDIPPVHCDENQIKQVLVNLLKNAIEAMENGGQITVTLRQKQLGRVSIEIQDQGPGIPQELLARLGEPFFSTKQSGTGLGLMVCYRIIEAHQGELHIRSQPEQGTTAEIILPAG